MKTCAEHEIDCAEHEHMPLLNYRVCYATACFLYKMCIWYYVKLIEIIDMVKLK